MLSGLGSDELFAGYYFHYIYWLYDKFSKDDYKLYFKDWKNGVGKMLKQTLKIKIIL